MLTVMEYICIFVLAVLLNASLHPHRLHFCLIYLFTRLHHTSASES